MVKIPSPVILLCGPKMSLKDCSHSYMFKIVLKVRRFPYEVSSKTNAKVQIKTEQFKIET